MVISSILVFLGRAMISETNAVAFRQNLGEMLNQVQYRHDSIVIKKDGKPVAALVVEKCDEHDAVEHRHAEDRDEADRRRYRQVLPGDEQPDDATDDRERDVGNDQRGVTHRVEGGVQQDEDQPDG